MGTGRKHSIRALVTVLGKNRIESLTSEIIQPNDAPVAILGLWKHNPLAVAVNIQPTQGEYFGAAHPVVTSRATMGRNHMGQVSSTACSSVG